MKIRKVALIHDYLIQYGGAEKTLEEILKIYPEADIFTSIYSEKNMPESIRSRNVYAIKNKFLERFVKYFTMFMPLYFEGMNLDKYDLIISDSSAWAKGVITNTDQKHISYIHTPPRFLYGYSGESAKRNKWYFKWIIPLLDSLLRVWDFNAAQRPDYLLCNSETTRERIKKFYNRDSKVINPPVSVEHKTVRPIELDQPYYVAVGRLVAYKNFDVLINVFNKLGWKLVIVGTGPEEKALKKMAKKNIIFVGRVSEEDKQGYLEGCLAMINPVEDEDFGITPIEAMSHGKPVLVPNSGGVRETVEEGVSGHFYQRTTEIELAEGVTELDRLIKDGVFDSEIIKNKTKKYSEERFRTEFKEYIDESLKG